ncbi:MAG: hypothetical protein EOP48_20500 [Sphingobacteriales bacterium]|nr:MAG: hypothetical protein EOP48_20500 [Sphingobacteriales bacterium]
MKRYFLVERQVNARNPQNVQLGTTTFFRYRMKKLLVKCFIAFGLLGSATMALANINIGENGHVICSGGCTTPVQVGGGWWQVCSKVMVKCARMKVRPIPAY